ncbi:ABC transporter permease [Phocaeicola coprophilus]|uniref:ABC transporter permease n=1 Tax=Phocaeicola coprophilus TaxID=387090 RepID=UPI0024314B6B|nr:ABC transporter permease [Phocaeicola coprophilus]
MKQFDLDTWEEILVTITRNKTRSLLTAFGIFWGIFMLISLLGGAKGMQETLSLQFKGFATNSGFMGTNQTSKAYRGFQQGRYWDLENKDVERILRNVEGADVVTPTLARWGVNIVYNEQKISGTLKGLYPIYSQIEESLITQGRYLNDMDVRDNRKVCIIGKQIYESLFPGGENPCGKYIEINGIYYQVIGVNMGTGNVSIQGNTETSVIIPFSTMQNNYNFGQKVQMIAYTARKGYAISEVEKDIARIVKQAHLIHPDDDQALVQLNAEVLFGMMDNLFSGIRILGWMVGLGTLLAGAIGVSNIMMVTVKERTTEIGIRRAIGARPNDILQQILSESIVLTSLAGMSGITFAVFLLNIVESATSTPTAPIHFQISFWQAIGACILLIILGLLAGLAPAYRAMAVKPIEAIRDE